MRKSGAPPAPGKKALNVFTLVMMNLAVICTLRGLPMMAEDGFSLVFYYLVTVLVFVIPVSLVSAELATSWPPRGPGGVYIWVKEAFGERWGFLAIWLQWIQNVIWFPTALSFIAGTMAYVFAPQLANNKVYMVVVILVVYWGGTLANFRGTKTSGTISSICVIGGVFVPGALIIMLGIIWIFGGNVSQISFSAHTFFPDLSDINNIVFLAGALRQSGCSGSRMWSGIPRYLHLAPVPWRIFSWTRAWLIKALIPGLLSLPATGGQHLLPSQGQALSVRSPNMESSWERFSREL
jgi:amino acid transporter